MSAISKVKKIYITILILLFCSTISYSSANTGGGGPPGGEKKNFVKTAFMIPPGMDDPRLLNLQIQTEDVSGASFQNAFKIGGTKTTQIGNMALDNEGNMYVTGGFTGTIEIGNTTLTSSKGYDVYTAKYDADHNLIWIRMAKGSDTTVDDFSLDGGTVLAVDGEGNIYVGGSFVKSLSFEDANGNVVKELTDGRNDNNLNFEMFVAKYDSDGNLLWAKGGNSQSTGESDNLAMGRNTVNAIVLDPDDYPYIAGSYSGSDFLGTQVGIVGKSDFFLASLDKNDSDIFWVSTMGTPDDDYAISVSADTLGYLNVLGVIGKGEMELPDTTATWNNDTGEDDTFVISYDVNGKWYFTSFIGAGEKILGNSIATAENGDFFVTGTFINSATFAGSDIEIHGNGSEYDSYVAKYDLNGDAIWAKKFGYNEVEACNIVTDKNDDVYIFGTFVDSVIFADDTDRPFLLTTTSTSDQFVAKYGNDGSFLWAKQISGTGAESKDLIYDENKIPFRSIPTDIVYSPNNEGELYLTGDFDGSINFDNVSLTSINQARYGFVAKLDLNNTTGIEDGSISIAEKYELLQNYPNPFNPNTTIKFSIPESGNVSIDIYNSVGQKIKTLINSTYSAGSHQARWNAENEATGVYVYVMKSGNAVESKKMLLLK
ncbi:MAG: T9SS type A sorting domain-containing protein [Melioribacteraceae bacterium]|nr:T9SS type A sorting domain-containing protein [Melioribacteraceae bacterium]MCF8263370.1 T9SS type A sorting domain-containing protein [Melioribacteraceae bacterium]MCF8432812.1 T9SS type A sorting domain-containing protein [Melioribacteraceae bacterium]